MLFSNRLLVVIYSLFIKLLVCTTLFSSTIEASECGTGKRPLFFAVDPKVEGTLPASFPSSLFRDLDQPLQEIGYCITRYTPAVSGDSLLQDELVLMLSLSVDVTYKTVMVNSGAAADDTGAVTEYTQADTLVAVIISTIRVGHWSAPERRKALANPLLSQMYSPSDLSTFQSVLIKKTVENLRMQYICHLRIESVPDGVAISSGNGLEGTTPLEWITPVGKLPITGTLQGYEPIKRKIALDAPGNHTYVLQMKHRSFYHSKFFVPSIVCATSSAASFVLMEYFDRKYSALTRQPRQPDSPPPSDAPFAAAHNGAVACEVAGFSLLGLAVGSFTLSFFF